MKVSFPLNDHSPNSWRFPSALQEVVRDTVEETLNALLDAEADALCRARRYERTADPTSPRTPASLLGRALLLADASVGLVEGLARVPDGPAVELLHELPELLPVMFSFQPIAERRHYPEVLVRRPSLWSI